MVPPDTKIGAILCRVPGNHGDQSELVYLGNGYALLVFKAVRIKNRNVRKPRN